MGKLFSFILFILSISLQSQIVSLTTTSKSPVWSPNKVIKSGEPLTWKASATGMTDQIDITNGAPTFDLSVTRTSSVTITASSPDGANGFTELSINSLNITSLSVSNAIYLTALSCTDNQLTELNTSNNTQLTELFCHSNQLVALDLTKNIQLAVLACFFNNISILDLTQNTFLSKLSCSNNLIKQLDLSNNKALISLECDENNLDHLNIKNGTNTNIVIFKTTNNKNLLCIQVDDVNYSNDHWKEIDSWSEFNEDCTFTNETPIANNDSYETLENTTLSIDAAGILSNDTDPDGDALISILESNVSHGDLQLNTDGAFVYSPNQNYSGVDSFTYKANDGELDSNISKVTIEVILVNSPPIANENSYKTKENKDLNIGVNEGVLSNDTDPDGDTLTSILETNTSHGDLEFNTDGSFIYSPHINFFGDDAFTYKTFDGYEYSSVTQVNIKIEAIIHLVIPNAFSPNNDQINDTFRPVFKGMSNVRLEIYDTWGNLIYFEEGQNLTGWDGTIKGKNAENGNFLYQVTAISLDEQSTISSGMLTLIK